MNNFQLTRSLVPDITLAVLFKYEVTRKTYNKDSQPTVLYESTFDLVPGDASRDTLLAFLSGKSPKESVVFPSLMPKFVKVKNTGTLKPIPQMIPKEFNENAGSRDISLRLFELDGVSWWEIKEICTDSFATTILSKIPKNNCDSKVVLYSFNDKIFPATLSFLTAGGIIGMYTTFVFLVSRFVRSFFNGSSQKIMFEDLPYVDRILQLCLDIYLVRESMEFALEEDLFAKLIFLYRSPETMIKWTRPKEEDATHPSISITRRDDGGDAGAGVAVVGGNIVGGENDTTSVPTSTPSALRRRHV